MSKYKDKQKREFRMEYRIDRTELSERAHGLSSPSMPLHYAYIWIKSILVADCSLQQLFNLQCMLAQIITFHT